MRLHFPLPAPKQSLFPEWISFRCKSLPRTALQGGASRELHMKLRRSKNLHPSFLWFGVTQKDYPEPKGIKLSSKLFLFIFSFFSWLENSSLWLLWCLTEWKQTITWGGALPSQEREVSPGDPSSVVLYGKNMFLMHRLGLAVGASPPLCTDTDTSKISWHHHTR